MKYMLLIHHNPNFMDDPPEPMDQIGAEVGRLIDELTASGEWVGGEGLADVSQAKVVRVRDGVPVVTDGPYLEAKEHLAGYCMIDCDSLDRALEGAAASCTLAAQLVDQPPVRGGEEPAARIGRHAVARPLQRRVEERLLHGVLARVEPSVAAHERPEDARRQPAQLLLDAHISSPPGVITGRTSIPIQRASGHIAATSSARSSESQSIMQ